MNRIIRKYGQFVKSKINEDINDNTEVTHDMGVPEDSFDDTEKNYPSTYNQNEPEEEEEADEYIGKVMMKELSEKLGVGISPDGSIEYDNRKIYYYSETECFHVDKRKFETVDEVVNFLNREKNKPIRYPNREHQHQRTVESRKNNYKHNR
jgi:hypothetical protein